MNTPFLTLTLADEADTLALGSRLGRLMSAGDFLALHGPLGAGKTTLARGLIRAFVGEDIEVPSPTFTLVQTYTQNPDAGPRLDLFHFDLYRLKDADEVWELGWEDIDQGVALVEWPDNAGPHLPTDRLNLVLSFDAGHRTESRQVAFYARDADVWKDRLNGA